MTPPDFKCSMVAAAHITSTNPVAFRTVMEFIRSERWASAVKEVRVAYEQGGKDAAAEPKKRLPGVMFSGIFSQRNATSLTAHSGLICVDLDGLNGATGSMKELIASDPHTLAAFVSPTGSGLKVIFRCNPNDPHQRAYDDAEHFVLENFGLKIDPACKDVSRLCFISHDPEAFVADDAEPLPHAPEAPSADFLPPGLKDFSGDNQPGDDYDRRHTLTELLIKHGWSKCPGGYTRPGKTSGLSATFDKVPGRFWCFTSSTQFEALHPYRPWAVYAILEHGGDFGQAAKALAKQGYGEQPKSHLQKNLDRVAGPAPAPKNNPLRKPSDFRIVPAADPSSLLGNRYLNRGDGMVISGPSGCGKSSLQTQMAARWALGEDFHGIRPPAPLRSLIIQSEDSDGDIAEVWQSLHHVLAHTETQRGQLDERVRIVTDRVNRGASFLASLRSHITEFHPDLVWINPLQAFIDGDITSSKDIGEFLRAGLNGLNEPASFGYVLIHHTTKPATGKDRSERLWHEVMYDMAGGAELINWARAIISLRPGEAPGDFTLRLAKRGRRAGVVSMVQQGAGARPEPVTEIPVRHSTGKLPSGIPIIYWEGRQPDPPTQKTATGGGRPEKHRFDDYRNIFPPKSCPGLPINELHRLLASNGEIRKDVLHNTLKRWSEQGHIEILRPHGLPMRFRCLI